MTKSVNHFYIKKSPFKKEYKIYSSQDDEHIYTACMNPWFITNEIIIMDLKDITVMNAKRTSWRRTAFVIFKDEKKIGDVNFPPLPTFMCSHERAYFELDLDGEIFTSSGVGKHFVYNSNEEAVVNMDPHLVIKNVEVEPSFDPIIALMVTLILIERINQVSL